MTRMASPLPAYNALVAAARILPATKIHDPKYDSWQDQAWQMYDQVGEFEAAISWKANAMSRVRLLAAEVVPGGDEPEPITKGPAAEAMERLAGGTGGQAQLMKSMTIHRTVVGEGWLVGETPTNGTPETWRVCSADELRVKNDRYELREGDGRAAYRPLATNSMVVRFHTPHPRFGWQADSETRHALGALSELDLANKRIVAELISRLASNGILLYNKQALSFPSVEQPEGADQVDPFAQILVDVASRGIKDPTSAEATIPIPIGFDLGDASMADVDPRFLLQLIQMSGGLDEKLLTQRESAVRRVATVMDMPPEILLGVGGMNHWGAWAVEETAVKIHIAPGAEADTHALTLGYLEPTLKAAGAPLVGPNGGRLVVWYDPSEITTRADKSSDTQAAYDRGEASGAALRRESGLSEGDKPSPAQLREWAVIQMLASPLTAPAAWEILNGREATAEPDSGGTGEGSTTPPADEGGDRDLPDTRDDDRPDTDSPDAMAALSTDEIRQRMLTLVAELDRRGDGEPRSGWFEHTAMTDGQRVTPRRRSGDVEPAPAAAP